MDFDEDREIDIDLDFDLKRMWLIYSFHLSFHYGISTR